MITKPGEQTTAGASGESDTSLAVMRMRAAEKQAAAARLIRERGMDIQRTFGLSKDDPDFDECVRLGREFRDSQQAP